MAALAITGDQIRPRFTNRRDFAIVFDEISLRKGYSRETDCLQGALYKTVTPAVLHAKEIFIITGVCAAIRSFGFKTQLKMCKKPKHNDI